MAGRRMPFLRQLMRREGYKMHNFYPGRPVDHRRGAGGALLRRARRPCPAFSYYDRIKREHGVMCSPDWAKNAESACGAQAPGLLEGGSSWSNIYTGGATPGRKPFLRRQHRLRRHVAHREDRKHFHVHPAAPAAHAVHRRVDAAGDRPSRPGTSSSGFLRGERLKPELVIFASRIFIGIGLRELVTLGAAVDLARGLPDRSPQLRRLRRTRPSAGPGFGLRALVSARHRPQHPFAGARRGIGPRPRLYGLDFFRSRPGTRALLRHGSGGGIEQVVRNALEISQQNDAPRGAVVPKPAPCHRGVAGAAATKRFTRVVRRQQAHPRRGSDLYRRRHRTRRPCLPGQAAGRREALRPLPGASSIRAVSRAS